jgi:modulator of FtsH protease HflK
MPSMGTPPPPPRRFDAPFDPMEWASSNPLRVFKLVWAGVAVLLVIWGAMTSFYTVEANEEAVVLRFGVYHTTAGPGFQGKLPFGIDKVLKGEVKTIHREEFGYRTISAGITSEFDYRSPGVISEATMLTGDLNLALVNWEVRYKIRNLKDYLFEVRRPVSTLRDVSEAVMRIEVGDRSVDEVLTRQRTEIEEAVAAKMQHALDDFKCGLHIIEVNLKRVDPPEHVKDAFNAVNQAIQEQARIINEAEGQRNQKIPAARGAADRAIRESEGYMVGRINRAEGDISAFLAVLAEYEKAEDVTRRRLYLEAMEKLLPKLGKVTLVDDRGGGLLKLLDLDAGEGK